MLDSNRTEHFEMHKNELITKQDGDAIVKNILELVDAQLEGPEEGAQENQEEQEDPITPEKRNQLENRKAILNYVLRISKKEGIYYKREGEANEITIAMAEQGELEINAYLPNN